MDNYNWDDVECDASDSTNIYNNYNHSEFFAYKHEKHEAYKQEDYQANESAATDFSSQNLGMFEDDGSVAGKTAAQTQHYVEDKENSISKIINSNSKQFKIISSNENNKINVPKLPLTENNNKKDIRNNDKKQKIPPNLLQNSWRHKMHKENAGCAVKSKPGTSKLNTKPEAPTPKAYKYSEIYEKRRQKQIEEVLNQEHKNRIFHSRPAPDFKKTFVKKSPQEHKVQVTIPITPAVLKKSKLFHEKEKKKLAEKLKIQLPIKHSDPKVLYEEPFKPKKIPHSVEPAPFQLHVEERLQKRRNFDEAVQKKLEEKKKQEEEEKQKKDEEIVKEFRKMTTFKARPNPFK